MKQKWCLNFCRSGDFVVTEHFEKVLRLVGSLF